MAKQATGAPRARRGGGPRAGDRGSVTIFVLFATMAALALASLLVDLGNAVNAQQRAADIAEQAARAAANTISVGSLRSGSVRIDTATACGNAANVVASYVTSGVQATMTQPCSYSGPRKVTVWVAVTTQPIITTFFGSFTMRAHESACAEFGIDKGVGC
ncbi:MAG TPA: pilus assembly protein TadG-related protein [Streptosporangiaceae bacterium]